MLSDLEILLGDWGEVGRVLLGSVTVEIWEEKEIELPRLAMSLGGSVFVELEL